MKNIKDIITQGEINHSWALFIDRDGVINQRRIKDYVKTWEQFIFIDQVLESLDVLSSLFGRMVIVTNQRGIGRGLMSEADLEEIHQRMLEEIHQTGGRIDQIYHCPDLEENDHRGWRKPKIGMALQAKQDFPDIDFKKSIMIGDAISDMEFGRNAGMYTVYVTQDEEIEVGHVCGASPSFQEAIRYENSLIDLRVKSMGEFCELLITK
ncbi:MAG: HAD family hydrolase [Bacteroidetes bacterium]|nr:HAD family hydrolase [Bacteroidota bacterium]